MSNLHTHTVIYDRVTLRGREYFLEIGVGHAIECHTTCCSLGPFMTIDFYQQALISLQERGGGCKILIHINKSSHKQFG